MGLLSRPKRKNRFTAADLRRAGVSTEFFDIARKRLAFTKELKKVKNYEEAFGGQANMHLNRLEYGTPEKKVESIQSLAQHYGLDDRTIPALAKSLKDKNALVRRHAVYQLDKLLSFQSPAKKIPLGIKKTVERLRKSDPNESVRSNASLALYRWNDFENKLSREKFGERFNKLQKKAIEKERKQLANPKRNYARIKTWSEEFGGELEQAKARLTSQQPEKRIQGIKELVQFRQLKSANEIKKIIQFDRDERVRMEAIKALGNLGGTKDVMFLARLLKEPKPITRYMALWSLEKIGDQRAIPSIVRCLNAEKENPLVRQQAEKALGEIAKREYHLGEKDTRALFGSFVEKSLRRPW